MASYATYRPSAPKSPINTLLSLTPLDPVVQKHLRKVYSTLSLSLVVAALGVYCQTALGINPGRLISSLVCIGLALYFHSLPPHNSRRPYVFYSFAFAEGWVTGPLISLVATIDPAIPLFAFVATAAIFMCFSVAAIFAKRRSYLFLGATLSSALTALFVLSIFNVFARSIALMNFQLYAALLAFCGFVLYDSQLIIEKAHLGERDYYKHAFELFMDLIALFRHVLIIMAKNSQQRKKNEDRRRRTQ